MSALQAKDLSRKLLPFLKPYASFSVLTVVFAFYEGVRIGKCQ